jgi:hypothetical protein
VGGVVVVEVRKVDVIVVVEVIKVDVIVVVEVIKVDVIAHTPFSLNALAHRLLAQKKKVCCRRQGCRDHGVALVMLQ